LSAQHDEGLENMNVIFASGALAKFLVARDRGASRQDLMRLKSIAEAEVPPSRAGSRREPSAAPAAPGKPAKTEVSDTSNVLEFINRAKFDRARLEREWESAPE
jgi:hypothetical protein